VLGIEGHPTKGAGCRGRVLGGGHAWMYLMERGTLRNMRGDIIHGRVLCWMMVCLVMVGVMVGMVVRLGEEDAVVILCLARGRADGLGAREGVIARIG
jgi:hypothetical protein